MSGPAERARARTITLVTTTVLTAVAMTPVFRDFPELRSDGPGIRTAPVLHPSEMTGIPGSGPLSEALRAIAFIGLLTWLVPRLLAGRPVRVWLAGGIMLGSAAGGLSLLAWLVPSWFTAPAGPEALGRASFVLVTYLDAALVQGAVIGGLAGLVLEIRLPMRRGGGWSADARESGPRIHWWLPVLVFAAWLPLFGAGPYAAYVRGLVTPEPGEATSPAAPLLERLPWGTTGGPGLGDPETYVPIMSTTFVVEIPLAMAFAMLGFAVIVPAVTLALLSQRLRLAVRDGDDRAAGAALAGERLGRLYAARADPVALLVGAWLLMVIGTYAYDFASASAYLQGVPLRQGVVERLLESIRLALWHVPVRAGTCALAMAIVSLGGMVLLRRRGAERSRSAVGDGAAPE